MESNLVKSYLAKSNLISKKEFIDIKIWLEITDTSYWYFSFNYYQLWSYPPWVSSSSPPPNRGSLLENYWRCFSFYLKHFKLIFSQSFLLCSVYDSENLEWPSCLMIGAEYHTWTATKIHDLPSLAGKLSPCPHPTPTLPLPKLSAGDFASFCREQLENTRHEASCSSSAVCDLTCIFLSPQWRHPTFT